MFIYIGNNELVETESIICIIDIELADFSEQNKRLIASYEKKGQVFGDKEEAKSVIITKEKIYYSPLATLTLKNRDELYGEMDDHYGVDFKFVDLDK